MSDLSLPTTVIEGIGRRVATDLGGLDVHTVGDLLRVDPERLRAALGGRRTVDQVRSWCNMARFLQVSVMTPQWAEALVRAGVHTPAEVRVRNLTDLREVFAKARAEGIIPDVPDDVAVASMMGEAAVLEFSGALNGTLRGGDGQPVAGADVRVGREHEVSDERGRFRIIRIPFGAKATLAVSHPACRPARFRLRRVEAGDFTGGQVFLLRRLRDGQPQPKRVLMEARGDVLPPIGDARVGSREVERTELVDRDIFSLAEFSADNKRGKLVSKLLVYEDGVFWLPYIWLSLADLKRGARPGDCFVLRGDAFQPIAMNPVKLRGWPEMLRMTRRMGPPPRTADELEAWLQRGAEMLPTLGRRRERH